MMIEPVSLKPGTTCRTAAIITNQVSRNIEPKDYKYSTVKRKLINVAIYDELTDCWRSGSAEGLQVQDWVRPGTVLFVL